MSSPRTTRMGIRLGRCLTLTLLSVQTSGASAQVQLTRLIGTGDPVPGLPGVEVASPRIPQIDNQGNFAVMVRFQGPSIGAYNHDALAYGRAGSWSLMFRTGDPAPGLEPLVLGPLGSLAPALAGNGFVGYSADAWDPADPNRRETGIWAGWSKAMALVLRTTEPPPGVPEPAV